MQVGWCIGRASSGEVLARGTRVVNPHDEVSPYITNLTGITPEQAEAGCHVVTAYHEMAADHRKHGAFCNPLTWGGGDSLALYAEVFPGIEPEGNKEWVLGRRWLDVKTIFIAHRVARGEPFQGGLARSMTKLGLAFQGRKHDAGDDALNTFRAFHVLLGLSRQQPGAIRL